MSVSVLVCFCPFSSQEIYAYGMGTPGVANQGTPKTFMQPEHQRNEYVLEVRSFIFCFSSLRVVGMIPYSLHFQP